MVSPPNGQPPPAIERRNCLANSFLVKNLDNSSKETLLAAEHAVIKANQGLESTDDGVFAIVVQIGVDSEAAFFYIGVQTIH